MSEIGKKIDYVVRTGLAPVLKAAGFTKKGRTFHRQNAESISVTSVQGSKWNEGDSGEFTINLGVYFPAIARVNGEAESDAPSEYSCHCRERIGDLLPIRRDYWWEVGRTTYLDSLAAEVGRAWADHAPGWYATRQTAAGAAALFMTKKNYAGAVSLYDAAGDRGAAQSALNMALATERVGARLAWLKRLGQKLRLTVPDDPAGPRAVDWDTEGPHWYTEEAWTICENPHHLVAILKQRGIDIGRKHRLAGAGCCRAAWGNLKPAERKALDAIEANADGEIKQVEMRKAVAAAKLDRSQIPLQVAGQKIGQNVAGAVVTSILMATWHGPRLIEFDDPARDRLVPRLTAVLRDVFGNPFHPLTFPKAWRTTSVLGLARGVYDEMAFDRLPILADALEEAGCDNADVLAHCRGPGPHVRGCWVIDGVLGLK